MANRRDMGDDAGAAVLPRVSRVVALQNSTPKRTDEKSGRQAAVLRHMIGMRPHQPRHARWRARPTRMACCALGGQAHRRRQRVMARSWRVVHVDVRPIGAPFVERLLPAA